MIWEHLYPEARKKKGGKRKGEEGKGSSRLGEGHEWRSPTNQGNMGGRRTSQARDMTQVGLLRTALIPYQTEFCKAIGQKKDET